MKRVLQMVLAFSLPVLAACGSASGSSAEVSYKSDPDSQQDSSDNSVGSLAAFSTAGTIEETELYNDNGLIITAKSLEYNNSSVTLNLHFDNSSDTDYSISAGSIGYDVNAVNGMMVQAGWIHTDVYAGSSADEGMDFSYNALQGVGVDSISTLEVGFTITDPDYHSTYTGPLKLTTSLAEPKDRGYEQSVQSKEAQSYFGYSMKKFDGDVNYQGADFEMKSLAIVETSDGLTALLEVKNNGSEVRIGVISDISFNDVVVCSGRWTSDLVNPGDTAVMTFDFDSLLSEEERAAIGMGEIGKVDFTFDVENSDYDSLNAAAVISETFGENTSYESNGTEVYNGDNIRILSTGTSKDKRYFIAGFIVENSGEEHWVDTDNSVSVNGTMVDSYSSSALAEPGKTYALFVKVSLDDLSEKGITDVTQMDVNFDIGWDTHKVTITY